MKTDYFVLARRLTRSPLYRRLGAGSWAARAMMTRVFQLWQEAE